MGARTVRPPLRPRPPPSPARPALALAAALGVASPARAFDAEVTATSAAQAYALRSPFGEPLLFRQRLTQTLGLELFRLLPDEKPGGPELFVKLRLRLDHDFGLRGSETTFNRADALSRYVPGLGDAPLDLMYGYVEGRRLAGGWLGFRAGRQYVVDPLGWWSFDGGLVRAGAPWLFAELYGGYEQRGGLPLSLGRYERDGVWRGDRSTALAGQPDVFPSFLEAASAPAWGAALEGGQGTWLHARASYRKVWNRGEVVTRPFALPDGTFATVDEARTSSERAGAALDATWAERGAVRAGAVYDLYNALLASHFASLDAYLGDRLTATLEYDYYRPTFDGDSIWNWFTHSPITTVDARAAWSPLSALDLAATLGARRWASEGGEGSAGPLVDAVSSVDLRARLNGSALGARAVGEWGERGRRQGLDLFGQRDLDGGKYFVLARTSFYAWRDDLRPERSAGSIGYVLGGGWRPAAHADARIEWEHNANRLVGQRYRIVALLNLWVSK
ncbi:MAG TPA: hypothetical protein VFS43_35495 [Polyangiaceae bacterium]|nr:hypothetical protein [Polyangiaceae bacterium]